MRKVTYSFLFVLLFLNSCSTPDPYWKFTTDKEIKAYSSSEWRCLYEPADNKIWVECYKKESTDTSFFYANCVEYEDGE